jgi:sortase (surface protein transpeptidase)
MRGGAASAPAMPWRAAGVVARLGPAIAAAVLLTACASGATPAAPAGHRSLPTSKASTTSAAAEAAGRFRSPRRVAFVPVPVRLRIPSIGIDTPLKQVGLDADGAIAAPRRFQDAAWFRGGPRPGQPGPAILLGHVDSGSGPAVFYRLANLRAGAAVLVDRADRTTVRFRVSGRIQVAKSRFPADLVYAPTLAPSLRLVTCGGKFDKKTGHYRDNVVVSAVPQAVSP